MHENELRIVSVLYHHPLEIASLYFVDTTYNIHFPTVLLIVRLLYYLQLASNVKGTIEMIVFSLFVANRIQQYNRDTVNIIII
jgi:hypothetical protein